MIKLLNEWWYILILAGVMFSTYTIKHYNLFYPIYTWLIKRIKNKKILLTILSFIGGILPIPGRVCISAGLLDTISSKNQKKRENLGILDYLSTHHYYLWSPLEATILIPMTVLKLSYLQVLSYTWPLLVISLLYLLWAIVKLDTDITIQKKIKKNNESFWTNWKDIIDWGVLLFVLCIIIFSNFIKMSGNELKTMLQGFIDTKINLYIVTIISFIITFILGSSSKFAGITSLLTSVFGLQYFTFFFAVDFSAYLLSPFHKCVAIGKSYFKTPWSRYYLYIGIWCILLMLVGIFSILFY